MRNFFNEEKGQGAIEYILLAGGIIAAAVAIFAVYSRITKSSYEKLESSTGNATEEMNAIIMSKVSQMNAT